MMDGDSNTKDRTNGRWTQQQHQKFLLGLQLYGKNWKKIEEMIVTRNGSQIRSHAQKYFLKQRTKFTDLVHDLQNNDPNSVAHLVKSKRKNSQKNILIPQLCAPNFWTQINQVLVHQHLSFWDLIDCNQKESTSLLEHKQSFKVFDGPHKQTQSKATDFISVAQQTETPFQTSNNGNCQQLKEKQIHN